MGAQLLHRSGTKRVTSCNQHSKAVLYQPERDLRGQKRKKGSVWSRVDVEPEPSLHYEHPQHADYIVIIPSNVELNSFYLFLSRDKNRDHVQAAGKLFHCSLNAFGSEILQL